ncbi:bifunctional helix-turn-helix transcriptional regulator/GNAT family N-acetyltransferase [Pleurocapsa sp. FMAR1]|uniref:bifunctional helix-turn-helix transcriptional regulator/GNAT family N-acetyltransferase n=1 Tax=Pleurocapsa sp. FMAR1 TaxID=3040204 RepID=UPI0029C790A6|nr:bifunctional helix-turn-helix transcriptional regulator/GNAT family N-acetyltransferase [Pleurocapsa sp. FMAR1]
MDFYFQVGKLALGSRLRRLSEMLTEDATKVYDLYEVPLDPKWFPVFYVLSHKEEASITEIAQIIGHSHPSVSQIIKEMKTKELVITNKSAEDARVNIAKLSSTGKQLISKIEKQYLDVTKAVEDLLSQTQDDLWNIIEEVEFLLADKNFLERVREARKVRERQQIEIIDYSTRFQKNFQDLNYEWIKKHFELEESDYQSLNNPDENILQPGGHIYLARYNNEIIGTCALIKVNDNTYELAKMAVTEGNRGRGIGWLLGQAAILKARELGAKTIFLESNTILKPAINLYQKLGFRKIVGQPSAYKRCNIQMELKLV